MASFFDDFKEKKKKKKSLVQTVTPAKAVKAKQETQTKTVSQSSKALANKNKSFVKGYENKKKVSLPTVTKPSLPKQTMNGSLRTPVRAMGETKKRAAQNTAVETRRRSQQTLSRADKKLSPVQQRAVQTYKANWDAAEARGDRAAMNLAHQRAENIRRQQGYSGGVAGDERITPKISREDRNLLNDSGQLAMKQTKLDFDRASATGNTLAMKEAILEMTALRKGEKYRSMDMQSAVGTDAYGRPIYGKTQREQLMGEAMGKAIPGSLLALRETANTALRNQARQRWTADKTPEMVNPNALGQRLMRESNMAGAMATQDLSGGKKLLAETAISVGQMLPGMAASAIPVVGPAIGAAMLSGQAAGAKAFELNERGILPGEVMPRALLTGGIEGLTEAIPLARLGNILTGSAGRSLVKNVLGQMGVEATEESIAYTANYLADKAFKDPEAVWTIQELGRNALAGAIAGGTLAGAGTMFNQNAQPQEENARRGFNGTDVRNPVENVESGLVRDDYTSRQDQRAMDEIDAASKRLGLTVQFADRVAGGMANASIRGNVVTIERNNRNPMRFLYGHEVAHYMQEVSPDAYTNFRAVIANEKEVSDRVEEIMAEGGLNWDQALDEVTADYAGTLIENERILQRFIQENQKNKPMLQRLADAFRGLLQKLTGKDKTKVQNAVEALELALEETVKGNRLRTGKEARIENRRAKQTQRWQENRREDLIQRLIQDYPTMEGEMKAQVDNLGIEGVVDAYLNGGNNPVLAAYEEAQTRYSFKRAGDTRQAEAMEAQGAGREEIWKTTGQIRDAKGNWVEEVDDSKAKFYPQGDARRQGNPDWVRLKELESKMLAGTITQEELTEANNLAQNLRGMPKGSTLKNYLDHPELYEAMPEIANTPFRMEDMEGVRGEHSKRGIAVNRNLSGDKRLSTTLHETQHAMQRQEGRPGGASKEYWAAQGAEDPKAMYRNTAGEIEARETQKRQNMTAEERRETMPDLGWDRAVFADKPVLANEAFNDESTPDYLGAVALMQANLKDLQTMEPLATVDGTEIPTEGRITERVMGYLDGIGRKVDRPGFGEVVFTKSRIKNSFVGHGIGNAKIELMAGVPGVIAQGKQIGFSENWKGRGYDSYVFAGPVSYKGETTYLTALVTEDRNGNRYYLHEVVDADGNMIYGKKEKTEAAPDRPTQEVRDTVADSVSKPSIPETGAESNEKFSDKSLSSYERAYEMVYGKKLTTPPKTEEEAADQASVGVIDRLQSIPEPKQKKTPPLAKPGERKVEPVKEEPISAEDLAYMDELTDAAVDRSLEAEFQAARDLIPGGVTDKTSMREKGKDIGGYAYRKLVDSGDEIRKAGKQSGDKYLYFYYNQAKASTATAQNMIAMRQTDVNGKEVGESLVNIFGPIKKKGQEYFKDFQDYLLHQHNIQRMGTPEERQMQKQARRFLYDFEDMHPEYKDMTLPVLREASDGGDQIAKEYLEIRKEKEFWDSRVKPVFNYEMTPEKSQTRVKQYEASHPEFKELAQRVYQYNRNLMQYRVDSGLISQETADFLQKKYPNYVPTFHKQDGVSTAPQEKGTRVGKTVKKATGSTGDTPFIDMDKAIAQQTMSVVRESAKNRFGQRLLNKDISQDYIINVESLAQKKQLAEMHDEDGFLAEQTNKDNTFTVYQNGKAYEITMTPAMYEGIKSLSPKRETDNLAVKVIIGANNIYKKAITSWNLIFTAKNFVKDLQDSLLYSKDLKGFGLNYFPAIKQILGNGDEWKLYQALGGTASSVYNSDQGVRMPSDKPISKMMGKVAFLNLAVEQWPRMAEFMATVKKGNRTQEELMEAMYRAADITTNFGRSGDVTKMLNSSFVPFLNPSIQGVDKIRRTIMENPREVGPWVALIGKAALLGIAPAVINYLAAGDEEDYDQLNQRDLDNNYMFPMGGKKEERDRYWIKVPKGRALAAIGAVANAGINAARGKEVDKKDLIDVVWNNIGFVNPLSGNIVKAWMDADLLDENSPGKTWYGSDIESQSMQTKRASERYNEKTDEISKLVGKVTGKSPAKINYLLDSYTGVLGDFILPWATKNDTASIAGRLASPFVKPFVLDSTTSNRLSGDFYELGDELTYSKQDGSYEDAISVKYWNKASQELAEVNDKIHKMEKNTALDSKEKRQKYRDLKAQANQIMLEAMSNMKTFRETAANYIAERTPEDGKKLYLTDKEQEDIFLQVTRDLFGAEQTLKYMGDDDYKRAQKANQAGVEYDTYLDFKDLMKRYDAIYDAEAALKYEDVEGTSETQFRRAAQQRVDKLHEKEADLIKVYSEGDTGWGTSPKHHKLAILADMELPLHEAVALWYTQILSNDDARNDADMREFKSLTKEQQYEYYQAVKFLNGYEDPKNPGHTKSKSRQNQIIPVIKSMGLTPRQKEIIWTDIENWSAKTLYLVR